MKQAFIKMTALLYIAQDQNKQFERKMKTKRERK